MSTPEESKASAPWYTNKDLFEMIGDLKDDLGTLRGELQKTITVVRQYNDLRQKLTDVTEKLAVLETARDTRSRVAEAVRQWGGWIVAVLALALAFKAGGG